MDLKNKRAGKICSNNKIIKKNLQLNDINCISLYIIYYSIGKTFLHIKHFNIFLIYKIKRYLIYILIFCFFVKIIRGLSLIGRAADSKSVGWVFKSLSPHFLFR
jgi:hypothetical protein